MELVTNLSFKRFQEIKPILQIRSQNFEGDKTKVLEIYLAFFKKRRNTKKWVLFFIGLVLALVLILAVFR